MRMEIPRMWTAFGPVPRHRFGDRKAARRKGKFRKGISLGSPDLVSQEVTGAKCVPVQDGQQAKSGKRNLTHQIWWLRFGPKSGESSGVRINARNIFAANFITVSHEAL